MGRPCSAQSTFSEPLGFGKSTETRGYDPHLANPEVQQRLVQYLSEGEALPRTEQELRNTIFSPQFQQALSSFSAALQSGQLGPLMTQFGLGEDVANAAAQGGHFNLSTNVDAFIHVKIHMTSQMRPICTESIRNQLLQDLDAFVKAMQAAQKKKDEEKSEDKEIKETRSLKPYEKDDRNEEEEIEY